MVGNLGATASATADTFSNASHTTNDTSESAAKNEAGASGSTGMSSKDEEHLTKFGVLLVNIGAASEEKVFGVKGSSAMQAYQQHSMKDLLVINRPEDDARAHPLYWYKPWTWWSSGPRVSPLVQVPAVKAPTREPPSSETANAAAVPPADVPKTVVTATQTDEAETPPPPAPAVAERKVRPMKKGLPTVDMRPLTDDEVAALTPAVQEDRAKVLKAEEHIHTALKNIEDMRYRYLVPARDLHCEAEVVAVVKCYAERHQSATALQMKNNSNISTEQPDNFSAPSTEKPTLRADLLACGPDVQRLKKCAEAMAMAYNHEGEVA